MRSAAMSVPGQSRRSAMSKLMSAYPPTPDLFTALPRTVETGQEATLARQHSALVHSQRTLPSGPQRRDVLTFSPRCAKNGAPAQMGGDDVQVELLCDGCASCGCIPRLGYELCAAAAAPITGHDLFRYQYRTGQGRRPWRPGGGRSSLPDLGAECRRRQ